MEVFRRGYKLRAASRDANIRCVVAKISGPLSETAAGAGSPSELVSIAAPFSIHMGRFVVCV